MTTILATLQPVILCELADQRTQPWGYSASEIYRFLANQGYRWYQTTPEGILRPAEPRKNYPPGLENRVAVAEERAERFLPLISEAECRQGLI